MQREAASTRTELPGGTVTMMFTDIAGSTELLREQGERYGALLEDHRQVVREVVVQHGGVEVDTQGDAFFVAFARASDAAAAALDLAERLEHAGPARVRIGMHTGEPSLSAGGYVGMDVHRAARISAAANGGQTVMSQQTRDLLDGVPVHDLGGHRLKDVGEVRLYQLGDGTFPPLRSLGLTNIHEGPELIGRADDAAAVGRLLADGARIVTVTGAGGIGKTSLARHVAWNIRDRFPDGAWFVDLSPVTDPALVLPEVASTLSAPADVAEHLIARRLLLVLDNLEQVMGAAPLLGDLVSVCPGVAVLTTSREPLRLQTEREYPLEPLGPTDGAALFRRQALTVAPRFDAPDEMLVDLSRHLDGLPLAIELAAARSRMLTPSQLQSRLDQRMSVLVGGARDAPQRHRTIEATIAWSHELLDPAEQQVFASLAVFAGEWQLEAAEQICECSLDELQALVDKNLVQAVDGRFRMLETIREFAGARLAELPEAGRLRDRHAAFYAALVERLEDEVVGSRQDHAMAELGGEYPNIRAAMEWWFSTGRERDGARMVAGLVLFWFVGGLYAEGPIWLERANAVQELDEHDSSRILWGLGLFATLTGDPADAAAHLAGAEAIADRALLPRILVVRGLLEFFADDMEACRGTYEQSIALAREVGDTWCLCDGLGTLGSIYPLMGELERAEAAGSEALSMARAARDLQGTRMALFALALVAVRRGELDTAREASEEGLEICRGLGDLWFVSYFQWILSTASRLAGDVSAAREWAAGALAVARQVQAPLLLVCALEASAGAAVAVGEHGVAAAQLEEAKALGRAGGVPASYVSEALRASAELAAEDDARALATEARDLAARVGDTWAERRAADLLATLPA